LPTAVSGIASRNSTSSGTAGRGTRLSRCERTSSAVVSALSSGFDDDRQALAAGSIRIRAADGRAVEAGVVGRGVAHHGPLDAGDVEVG
jgi:hypothetical protein